jgi:hypothetical protein
MHVHIEQAEILNGILILLHELAFLFCAEGCISTYTFFAFFFLAWKK